MSLLQWCTNYPIKHLKPRIDGAVVHDILSKPERVLSKISASYTDEQKQRRQRRRCQLLYRFSTPRQKISVEAERRE
ncbi:hypothetical protein NPIL_454501 [Nephila pilipes]|uniref:Uncharacterized protein n=1 Tax=Nephila pilipes TaxID=299642 RepID=A0A8X6TZB6_NEPPI|nr:hypothetical protein NPIL_454501 [Nephila pilipes]